MAIFVSNKESEVEVDAKPTFSEVIISFLTTIAGITMLFAGAIITFIDDTAGGITVCASGIICLIIPYFRYFKYFEALGIKIEMLDRKIDDVKAQSLTNDTPL